MAEPDKSVKHRVYYPPEPAEIEEAAALLRQKMDRDSDFEDGFGGLLKAIAKAYANHLNRENGSGVLDNDHETA
ncbi:MAG: hypothetical protein KJ047_05215 [Anaerolineae bacterium]|jgi:hypothetical protein|nr:hypothetical protein [Anaerolineae bacterium]